MVIVRAMLGSLSPHLNFSTSQYIFWMLIFLGPVCTQETKITCRIPSVPPLHDTVLTCHFPEDLSVTKKDFTVYHYVQHDIPESVLDCWWIKGVLDCYTKPGFKFDRRVSQTLNTTIHNVTMANTGFYTCQVAGYSPDLLETCEFSLKPVSGSNIKCNLSSTTLMCIFNQDVQKTQKRFAVYRHNAKENQNVVDCSWEYGILYCNVEDGYFFNKEVSSYIQVEIPSTDTKGDTYSCWLDGSDADKLAMCFLETESEENSVLPMVAVGISLGLLLVIASSVIGIFICRLRRRARKSEISQEDELQEMINKDKHPITQAFQDFQLKTVKDMYPDMLKGLYFVPPVYFNKIQYTTQSVAGQTIHIADSPDPSDVRHDQAMQHVLHCVRHMAQEENMFVLTQFKYEDYLNNPSPDFAKHSLPTFSSLKKRIRDKDEGCFDILFIHRLHGVFAGVVKSVSDKYNDCEDGGGSVDDHLVTEVSDAIRKLNKARNVLQHLLSDQEQITVRLILMLPNVAMSTLERALNNHTKVAQELHDCLHLNATGDSTQLCLCADHLSSPSVPWKVNSTVVNHLKQWWEGVTKAHADQPKMTTELFQDIVARFCGPATQSCLHFSIESKHILPKTLNQAISLTSHLFEQCIPYPGMKDMLEEPCVFLSGPPGTGKTRMLALVGRKWMSEGHVVHVITSVETREATTALEKLLLQTPMSQSQTFPESRISRLVCEINDKKKRDESIEKLIGFAKLNPLFALIDELVLERWKETNVEAFLKSLRKTIPNLHLWTASCIQNIKSPDWKTCILTEPLSCPPAVVRQIKRKPNTADIKEYSPLKYLPPTDGLPVKIFSHKGRGHTGREPRDCDACGKNVVKFLTQSVQLTDTETKIIEMNTSTGIQQTALIQCPALQYRDVLILFESDVTRDSPIVKALSNIQIQVQVIDFQKPRYQSGRNSVLAARTSSLCTLRRKVVVYVEGVGNRSNISLQSDRQRGLTSCTSQLVIVKYSRN